MSTKAIYVQGSIYKHLLNLTFLGIVGLISRFLIDAINIYFVGLLPNKVILIDAIGVSQGYSFLFFAVAITASITIGMRVGFLYGLGKFKDGKSVFSNLIFAILMLSIPLTILACTLAPYYFRALGVPPEVMPDALLYTRIMLSAFPSLVLGMTANAGLAIIGRPHIYTFAMIIYSVVDAILTYILMIHFRYGVVGLGIANIVGRLILVLIVWYPLIRKKALFDKVKFYRVWHDVKNSLGLFIPTFFSQLSNMLFMTIANKFLIKYDPAILAGFIAITKIFPLAYCFDFALGGAFSTVFSQNLGAKNVPRLYESIKKAVILGILNVIIVTIVLGIIRKYLIIIFGIEPKAYALFNCFIYITGYFYAFVAISNIFTGVLQNIRKAMHATVINIISATAGLIFFLWLFQIYFGERGIFIGWGVCSLIFSTILAIVGFIMLRRTIRSFNSPKKV